MLSAWRSRPVQRLIAEARACRLAEVRGRQHTTQVEVTKAMGVTQARVSRIEKGQLERNEVDTLAAYVQALGGKLKTVADFGDESYCSGLTPGRHGQGVLQVVRTTTGKP